MSLPQGHRIADTHTQSEQLKQKTIFLQAHNWVLFYKFHSYLCQHIEMWLLQPQ
jgi:hypothetical protein